MITKAARCRRTDRTGTITPFGLLGAVFVLAGMILGLSRAAQASAGTAGVVHDNVT